MIGIVSLKGSERRREERVLSSNLLNLMHLHELYPGRTLDLSPQGAQVELGQPLPARNHPHVDLQLCLRDRVVGVRGRVVWVQRKGSGRWAHGIEFERPASEVREHLALA